MEKTGELKQRLEQYRLKEEKWMHQKEVYLKTINLMQMELNKMKAKGLKKFHKRTCSDEQTFIFNQTNISSYFPIVVVKTNNWTHKANLRSHLDSVRALAWRGSYLLSSGDDFSLKVWEKQQLKTTVRDHLGPVYSICSTSNQIFTCGAQGVIRKWSMAGLLANQQPQNQAQIHQDSIWQIIYSEAKGILVTSSADQSHKIVSTLDSIEERSTIAISNDTPTSIDWLGDNKFVSGYVRREKLIVYDVETGKTAWEYGFDGKQTLSQTNKITISNKQKMIATAHEDHCIRFFDAGSNKQIKELPAHSDSVTSICFRPEGHEIVSCGHDGNLRIWDLRKYKCVGDLAIHMRKFDESALCLAHNKEDALLAVGGADGLIKILHPEH